MAEVRAVLAGLLVTGAETLASELNERILSVFQKSFYCYYCGQRI